MIRRRCRDCLHARVSRHPKLGMTVSCSVGMWPKHRQMISLDHINIQIDAPFVPGTATPLATDCPKFLTGDGDDD